MSELSETFKRLESDPHGGSQHLIELLESFLMPFLLLLDEVLDKRLVRTFVPCLVAIIRLRNNPQALWRSRLGSYLQGYEGYACSAKAGNQAAGKPATVGEMDRRTRFPVFCSRKPMKRCRNSKRRGNGFCVSGMEA